VQSLFQYPHFSILKWIENSQKYHSTSLQRLLHIADSSVRAPSIGSISW